MSLRPRGLTRTSFDPKARHPRWWKTEGRRTKRAVGAACARNLINIISGRWGRCGGEDCGQDGTKGWEGSSVRSRWVNLGGDVYSRRRRRARRPPSFLLCYVPTSTASSSSSSPPPPPPSSSSRERRREKETSTRLAPSLARISSPTEHTTATRQTAGLG